MDDEDRDIPDFNKLKTYEDYLNTKIDDDDRYFLEEDELCRDVKDLYAVNKGEIKSKEDFLKKKKEYEDRNKEVDTKEKKPFSQGKTYSPDSLLYELQQREVDVKNARKSTIIFIRYKESKYKETSAYIDFRERLRSSDMEDFFNEKKDLIPKITDLSYYNWNNQTAKSTDSTYFRVDAAGKEKLSFKNNTDRKVIHVDLDFIDKNPSSDVKRQVLDLSKQKSLIKVTKIDPKKENLRNNKNKKKIENEEEEEKLGYQQIVIFDYETRSK